MNYERNHYLDAYKQFYQVELVSMDVDKCEKFLVNCVHLQDLFNRTFMDLSTLLGVFLRNKSSSKLLEAQSQIMGAANDTQRSPFKQKSQRGKLNYPNERAPAVAEPREIKPVSITDLVFNSEFAEKKTVSFQKKLENTSVLSPEGHSFQFKGKQFPPAVNPPVEPTHQGAISPAKNPPPPGCPDCRKHSHAMRTPDNEIVYILSQKCPKHRAYNEPRPFIDLKTKPML